VQVERATLRPVMRVTVAFEYLCDDTVDMEDVCQREAAGTATYNGDA